VAGAADLAGVQDLLAKGFEEVSDQRVRFTLGASGMLARQIEQGAPYDVFLSANERFVDELVKAGRLEPGSVRVYGLGRLGLWSKGGAIREAGQLRGAGVLHLALPNPVHAPYGVAAKEFLQRRGLWGALERKVVYGENVRQALQFAESGNAEAVITAWSLVFDRGGVLLAAGEHAPIRQSGGVVTGRPHAAAARRFLEFLGSERGRRILEAHGFSVPGK
jgi:molybdate transport system substrate-binding protein